MHHIVLMIYNSLVLFNLLWCGKKVPPPPPPHTHTPYFCVLKINTPPPPPWMGINRAVTVVDVHVAPE